MALEIDPALDVYAVTEVALFPRMEILPPLELSVTLSNVTPLPMVVVIPDAKPLAANVATSATLPPDKVIFAAEVVLILPPLNHT